MTRRVLDPDDPSSRCSVAMHARLSFSCRCFSRRFDSNETCEAGNGAGITAGTASAKEEEEEEETEATPVTAAAAEEETAAGAAVAAAVLDSVDSAALLAAALVARIAASSARSAAAASVACGSQSRRSFVTSTSPLAPA